MLPSALRDNNCEDCCDLWKAYAAAITARIRLENLLLTVIRHGCDIANMEAKPDKADVDRERLREVIRDIASYDLQRGADRKMKIGLLNYGRSRS
jgi:hypothetical protein